METLTVLGLMSGTSMDGLDCGLFNISLTSGYELDWSCIEFITYSYSNSICRSISNALEGNESDLVKADRMLGVEFAAISEKFINERPIDLISTHGQTVDHNDGVSTLQIGAPKFLSETFQVPVVYNVRQADIDVGGNGAPLMPFLDWLLFNNGDKATITLNLGGVANISFIPKSGKRNEVIGFDTGPGMALIDECCKMYYGDSLDWYGSHAKKGIVNETILTELMNHKFIHKSPPKSTGRHDFGAGLVDNIIQRYSKISPENLIRTFCAFTGKSIAENLDKYLNFNMSDVRLIISGGGVHHPILMQDISKYTRITDVKISDELEIRSDMKEALLMAVLGVARKKEMTASMPGVTGAEKLVVLGDLII